MLLMPPTSRLLTEQQPALHEFFAPRSVAVIGATETERSVGRTVLENLSSFAGPVYPINPHRASVLGRAAYPKIDAVPGPVELAVIVTPAATVPGLVAECAAAGVPAAIVISAGFKEAGPAGVKLENDILAARGAMRIIGPNCLGLMAPRIPLNATFAGATALPGSVAFLSQSGALCTAILDWSLREKVGFSAFVSIGSMLDVGWGDLIDYLGDDPHTQAILIYMESIGDARSFLSAAREVALTKPIVIIKAGRTAQAAQAAASHTGALTGSDDVLDAALRRCGVLRVNQISDLFYLAEALAKQPRPQGPRLMIVTNAGGPGVLATDALIADGAELAGISASTLAELDAVLPAHWSRHNPVDILGDAPPARYAQASEIVVKDPGADGLLIALAPQGMTDPSQVAESVLPFATGTGKPVLASWMGGASVARGVEILNAAGIPTFAYPDTAARIFAQMWRYSDNLRSLYETPELAGTVVQRDAADRVIEKVRAENRTLLTEPESKHLLAAYGIPATRTETAATEDEAVRWAIEIGFPVALKLFSFTITHKTDVGGVELGLRDEPAVRAAWKRIAANVEAHSPGGFEGVTVQPMVRMSNAYELILGSSLDPQFGPVLLFGAGGQLVETFRDRALGLPPLNSTLARRLMEQTRIYRALGGVRGRAPVDLAQLEQVLVRFSQLIVEQPRIKEIDINPLLVSADTIIAVDGRVVLHDGSVSDARLPRPAIRPYPSIDVNKITARDGSSLTLRPIRPEDEPAMARFHETLSDRSVYLRYFHRVPLDQRVAHERLIRACFVDYDRETVLVAETPAGEIVAAGRLTKTHGTSAHGTSAQGKTGAVFALLVSDRWQEQGLGTELLRALITIARREKISRLTGPMTIDNVAMREICKWLGFEIESSPERGVAEASLVLDRESLG